MATVTDKPWGNETLLVHTDRYAFKILTVEAGEETSLQFHREKSEILWVLEGYLYLERQGKLSGETIILSPGNFREIRPGEVHRLKNKGKEKLRILEFSTPELNDVVRMRDKYGRANGMDRR